MGLARSWIKSLGASGACVGTLLTRQLIEHSHNSPNLVAVRRYSRQDCQVVGQGLDGRFAPNVDAVLGRQQDPALFFTMQRCPPPAGTRSSVGEPILDRGCLLDLHF